MFQAYLITCSVTGRHYVGITTHSMRRRWVEHLSCARRMAYRGALCAAIRKHGEESFTIEALCEARSWADLCVIESILIQQWSSLAPNGYNLCTGGDGRYGFRPSAESVEESAAKHRGKPCHPNTRRASVLAHKGKAKSAEHRAKIAAAHVGKSRSAGTRAKLSAYWKARRENGEFKTPHAYAHSRKAASAAIAKIPFPLASYIARAFRNSIPESSAARGQGTQPALLGLEDVQEKKES